MVIRLLLGEETAEMWISTQAQIKDIIPSVHVNTTTTTTNGINAGISSAIPIHEEDWLISDPLIRERRHMDDIAKHDASGIVDTSFFQELIQFEKSDSVDLPQPCIDFL